MPKKYFNNKKQAEKWLVARLRDDLSRRGNARVNVALKDTKKKDFNWEATFSSWD